VAGIIVAVVLIARTREEGVQEKGGSGEDELGRVGKGMEKGNVNNE